MVIFGFTYQVAIKRHHCREERKVVGGNAMMNIHKDSTCKGKPSKRRRKEIIRSQTRSKDGRPKNRSIRLKKGCGSKGKTPHPASYSTGPPSWYPLLLLPPSLLDCEYIKKQSPAPPAQSCGYRRDYQNAGKPLFVSVAKGEL